MIQNTQHRAQHAAGPPPVSSDDYWMEAERGRAWLRPDVETETTGGRQR